MLKSVEVISLKLSIKMSLLAALLGTTLLTAAAQADEANPSVVADPVTAALMDATLRKPEVASAIHAGANSGNAASTPGNRPMIQVMRPAPQAGQSHLMLATIFDGTGDATAPQMQRRAGVDLRVGAPMGVGIEFHYTIVAPVRVGVALDTSLATYAVTAEATVSILPIFVESRWTPTVTVAFSHVQFTGMSDSIMKK